MSQPISGFTDTIAGLFPRHAYSFQRAAQLGLDPPDPMPDYTLPELPPDQDLAQNAWLEKDSFKADTGSGVSITWFEDPPRKKRPDLLPLVIFMNQMMQRIIAFWNFQRGKRPVDRADLGYPLAAMRYWDDLANRAAALSSVFRTFRQSRAFRRIILRWFLNKDYPLVPFESVHRNQARLDVQETFIRRVRRAFMTQIIRTLLHDGSFRAESLLDLVNRFIRPAYAAFYADTYVPFMSRWNSLDLNVQRNVLARWEDMSAYHQIDFGEDSPDDYLFQCLLITLNYALQVEMDLLDPDDFPEFKAKPAMATSWKSGS
ncbi:hypothetical protein SISSUDRAFT_1107889, partial [Sistotremastrum suecicum HHB10207 ss-3]